MTPIPRALLLLLIAAPLFAQQPGRISTPAQIALDTSAKEPSMPVPPQMQRAVRTERPPSVTNADRADVYKGLITTLHDSGEDKSALAQLQSMPPEMLARLSLDPDFLVASAGVYSGIGDNAYALRLFNAAEERYILQNKPVPFGFRIQNCYLLLKTGDDAALYSRLLYVTQMSQHADALTPEEMTELNNLWISFALRRASEEDKAGNDRVALRMLITAHDTYPDSALIKRSLAGFYMNAGDPKRALQLYKEADFADASPGDYQGAIGAALATGDRQDAEKWLRLLVEKQPTDPAVLTLAAKLEKARGNRRQAARYYRAALENMPKEKPGAAIPPPLRNEAPPTTEAPSLASVIGPGAASASTVRSPGNAYLPGEKVAPVFVPIFVPQRQGEIVSPSLPVASESNPSRSASSTVRPRPTSCTRRAAVNSATANASQKTERLGDYDPSR